MKKVLAIILSVAMLACFATSALAEATASYTMASDKEYVKAGEDFVVTVRMPEGRMSTGNIYLDYDVNALEVDPISGIETVGVGAKASGAGNVLENGVKQGMAFTYPSDNYKVKDDPTALVAVTFTVPADAKDDTKYEIKLRVEDVTVAKSKDDPTTEDVTVTVCDPITVTVGEAPASSVVTPDSSVTPAPGPDDSSVVTPSDDTTPSTAPSTTAPSTTAPSTNNPKTGDAGVAVFAGIVAAAAAAAFVVGKKKA